MSLRFLLDTNVLSEPLKPRPSRRVLERLRRHEGESACSAIAWHELRFGCARLPRSRRRNVIEHYLTTVVSASFPILEYDRAAAEWHALERARLAADGKTPPFIDGQIAAIAYVNDLVLVTENRTDFRSFKGLQARSWA